MTEDPMLSRRYRELPREEPPAHLDEAILAAARREVQARRWSVPLATAAVIMLAVAVTLQIERERPGEEIVAMRDAPPPAPAGERKALARADTASKPAPMQAAPMRQEAFAEAAGNGFFHASPEQWLQGIADLRRQNRDHEADEQLAEFRRRYPDYRIPKEMLERVEMPK